MHMVFPPLSETLDVPKYLWYLRICLDFCASTLFHINILDLHLSIYVLLFTFVTLWLLYNHICQIYLFVPNELELWSEIQWSLQLHLQEGGLHADINGDGVLDHVQVHFFTLYLHFTPCLVFYWSQIPIWNYNRVVGFWK